MKETCRISRTWKYGGCYDDFRGYDCSCLFGSAYACAIMLSNVTFAIYGTEQYGEAYSFLAVILNLGRAYHVPCFTGIVDHYTI